ncbi:vacuolar protein sorting-associated protein 33A-like [Rhagoletis pomonella]|uniref:vacuolar protein sorting-associated protein 33A-like n=1 Tax=Rhagoletis pomonella TaxID=28610 RepID=UPI00177DE18C|nr:vacuolar protein sorting-associated protein 33A-like [Rhagoletis pomonella]XP_036343470.1 vacuolar protein sorting-associated protein 33A-like [Rhagoletis pomonella]
MFQYLQSQRVNIQLLQESACNEIVNLLELIDGPKLLLLDEEILGPLGLVASPNLFSERSVKLLKFGVETQLPRDACNVIYVVRSQLCLMDILADHVKKNLDKNRQFHIYFVPRRSCLCIKHLENLKVYDNFTQIKELEWNFLPVDNDIVSMEMSFAFRDVEVDGDPTVLYQAAVGLVQLQRLYGRIPKIYGKGANSQRVWEHAKQLGAEEKIWNGDKGLIDQIILLDRSIDILSGLATQLTYEGLIDEFFGIKNNQLSLPAEHFTSRAEEQSPAQPQLVSGKKTIFLNSGEKLYAELRNKNFNEVGKILSRNAREISSQMNTNAQDASVQDMKRFVDKLPALLAQKQSVAVHTSIAELIRKELDAFDFSDDLAAEQEFMMCEDIDKASAYIEGLIAKKADIRRVLRLLSMQCAAASGFKEKVLNYYKRELVQVYGLHVLLKISNLEKAGLLYTQSESRSYAVLRKTLNLTVDDVVEVEPKDISYVHSFYAPLTARIIEQTIKPLGWQSLKSQINNLPGPTFEDFQAQLICIGGRHNSSTPIEGSALNIPRVIMIFFIGGCTFAEIAALRFLSQQEDNNVEFVIATTKIINKHTFIDCLM